MKSHQIVQITDTTDIPAQLKIRGAYVKHAADYNTTGDISIVPGVNDTLIGLQVSELVTNTQRPKLLSVAVNYAPPDNAKGTKENHRHGFFCAKLPDGVIVCGTNHGLEFSYVKPLIKDGDFFILTNSNNGSQFRSLEVLPKAMMMFRHRKTRERMIEDGVLKRPKHIDDVVAAVPDVSHTLEVDNFGNVKIVLSQEDRRLLAAHPKKDVFLCFGDAAIQVGGDLTGQNFGEAITARSSDKLFDLGRGKNILAGHSSSTLVNNVPVPILATLRERPAETRPSYIVPGTGVPVRIALATHHHV